MMKRAIIYALSILILFGIWWGASVTLKAIYLGQPEGAIKAYALPPPLEALKVLRQDWKEIGKHFTASAYRTIISILLSLAIAVPLGLILGHEKTADTLLSPIVYTTYPIPKIVFLPLLFVFLGLGNVPRIALITLIIAFQILLSARDAAKNIPKDYIINVLSTGASKWQVYKHVVVPASLPAVLTSARISIGLAIAALALTESWVAGVGFLERHGLWYYISYQERILAYADMFAGIMALALLGLLLYIAIDVIERLVCRWNYL